MIEPFRAPNVSISYQNLEKYRRFTRYTSLVGLNLYNVFGNRKSIRITAASEIRILQNMYSDSSTFILRHHGLCLTDIDSDYSNFYTYHYAALSYGEQNLQVYTPITRHYMGKQYVSLCCRANELKIEFWSFLVTHTLPYWRLQLALVDRNDRMV